MFKGGGRQMGFWEGFHAFCMKFVKLIYLNFIWLFFSAIGLFAFGIFPATIALFTVMRQWQLGIEKPIVATFWLTYKKEWLRGNGYALISYVVLAILAADFYMIYTVESLRLLLIPTIIIAFLIIGTLFFFFPVYVHFQLSFWQYIKQAFLFTLISPLTVIYNCLVIAALYGLFNILPGAIPMFVASVICYCAMKLSLRIFNKVTDQKKVEATA